MITEATEFKKMKLIKGKGISAGAIRGKLRFFRRNADGNTDRLVIVKGTPEVEQARLDSALGVAREQLVALFERAKQNVGEDEAQIFAIHKMLLEDEDFTESAYGLIDDGKSAAEAIRTTAENYSKMFGNMDDEYLSARAGDILDVSRRIINALTGGDGGLPSVESGDEPFILVADDLSPSETIMFKRSQILGFVTFGGSPDSHTAILARAMGIPAIIGTGVIDPIYDGENGIVDAGRELLIIAPDEEEIEKYNEIKKEARRAALLRNTLIGMPSITKSGHKFRLYANIGNAEEAKSALENDAEGIGLLRSEFLYLGVTDYPDEEYQFEAYKKAAQTMCGKPVIIRTLDVGADKKIPYFNLPDEANPALGFRAIRICLSRTELFRTQLRAICRASAFGKIAVMLPMIVSLDEIKQSKRILTEVRNELRYERIDFDEDMKFGIMIETPASVVMSDLLAPEVDFFSVGTNDLCQYTLAADRQNPAVAKLCHENTEPILRQIKFAADNIHKSGEHKWIGICGELAADTTLTQKFADMGIDELSVSSPYILKVREKIRQCK